MKRSLRSSFNLCPLKSVWIPRQVSLTESTGTHYVTVVYVNYQLKYNCPGKISSAFSKFLLDPKAPVFALQKHRIF